MRAECPDHLVVRTAWLYGAKGACFLEKREVFPLKVLGELDDAGVLFRDHAYWRVGRVQER